MSRFLIVSNRLPLQIQLREDDMDIQPSVGGLATGMRSVHDQSDSLWIGWTGLAAEHVPEARRPEIEKALAGAKCAQVPLDREAIDRVYFGFSNQTLWPLFHYFTEYTIYDREQWDAYVGVNRRFADVVLDHMKPGDRVWVHDYQLLLLPSMLREAHPQATIGFFLHIPFPSFEVFRCLPWRREILEGMLGADLLGFHTYNYVRHFFSSIRRLLGHDIQFHRISLSDRVVTAEPFPMGIDYDRFHRAAEVGMEKASDAGDVHQALDEHAKYAPDVHLVLSIDRLDYTKGIALRLHAFVRFLEKYPEFRGKVVLLMLAVPSRAGVEQYQLMKSEVDELVGRINGQYGTMRWNPVRYFYRSLPFEELVQLYSRCDIALLTPIRDGMNLVAKEYVASRVDGKGVLILSEMAGASHELSEALLINPHDADGIADALCEALLMPESEQRDRIRIMQARLRRYNIDKWAKDFLAALEKSREISEGHPTTPIDEELAEEIAASYASAGERILFLDYDGTLVGFRGKPAQAVPDAELTALLDRLENDPANALVLVSGRDRATLDRWFGKRRCSLIAEHGVWLKEPGGPWTLLEEMDTSWKEEIRPVLERYVDRTPGTFIEEKKYSLVWHYRKTDPDLAGLRANELKDEVTGMVANHALEILEGSKVIEVKNLGFNKGRAARHWLGERAPEFLLAMGDDWTDEFLFEVMPERAVTVKVGRRSTKARYSLSSWSEVRRFLFRLAGAGVLH